jgi:hypothetical protein
MKLFVIGLCCALAVSAATATDYRKIEGTYGFATKSIIDPDPAEKPDRLVVYLEGQSAKDVYKRMPIAAVPDPCGSKQRVKMAGDLWCSFDPDAKDYSCSFGLLLKTGRATYASVC